MKLSIPSLKTNLVVVTTSVLLGGAIVYANSQSTPIAQLNTQKTAGTSQTPSDGSTTSPDQTSQSTVSTGGTNTETAPSTPTDGTGSALQPASGQQTETPQVEDPVVTVVGASFAWSAPNPGVNNSTERDGVCTYTYSDGSVQTVADGVQLSWGGTPSPDGTVENDTAVSPGPGCDVSIAPTAN